MMAKRKKNSTLFVGINGQHVGIFERRGGTHAFTYDDEWLSSEYAHPISLSMPLTAKMQNPLTFSSESKRTRHRIQCTSAGHSEENQPNTLVIIDIQ